MVGGDKVGLSCSEGLELEMELSRDRARDRSDSRRAISSFRADSSALEVIEVALLEWRVRRG